MNKWVLYLQENLQLDTFDDQGACYNKFISLRNELWQRLNSGEYNLSEDQKLYEMKQLDLAYKSVLQSFQEKLQGEHNLTVQDDVGFSSVKFTNDTASSEKKLEMSNFLKFPTDLKDLEFKAIGFAIGKAMVIITGLATLADLLQPIAPFAGMLSILGLVGFLLSLVCLIKLKLYKLQSLTVAILCLILSTVSLGALVLQNKTEGGKQIGWIQTLTKNSGQLIEISKTLKKEISDNPRKELNNLGIKWNVSNFERAIKQGDVPVVSLFLEGGFKVTKYTQKELIRNKLEVKIQRLLFANIDKFDKSWCKVGGTLGGLFNNQLYLSNMIKTDEYRSRIIQICGKNNLYKAYQEKLKSLRLQMASFEGKVDVVTGKIKECNDHFFSKYKDIDFKALSSVASGTLIQKVGMEIFNYKIRPENNSLATAHLRSQNYKQIIADDMMGHLSGVSPQVRLNRTINTGCTKRFPLPRKPSIQEIKKLESILGVLL